MVQMNGLDSWVMERIENPAIREIVASFDL